MLSVTGQLTETLSPGFDPDKLNADERHLLRVTIGEGFQYSEINRLMYLAKCYGLDPLKQEICLIRRPSPNGNQMETTVITSRDGYLQVAQRHPDFQGLISFEVREGDEFQIDAQGYEVQHRFGATRGELIGAWAKCDRAGKRPFLAFAPFHEYYRRESGTWQKFPSAMIKKVAEVMVLKRAFSISGLVAREEISPLHDPQVRVGSGTGLPGAPPYAVGRAIAQLQHIRTLEQLLEFERNQAAYIAADADFREAVRRRRHSLRIAVGPATTDQIVELRRLLESPHVLPEERFRMECALDTLTFARAARAIGNLHETIAFRTRAEETLQRCIESYAGYSADSLYLHAKDQPEYIRENPLFQKALLDACERVKKGPMPANGWPPLDDLLAEMGIKPNAAA